jgi:hypothetical protein
MLRANKGVTTESVRVAGLFQWRPSCGTELTPTPPPLALVPPLLAPRHRRCHITV